MNCLTAIGEFTFQNGLAIAGNAFFRFVTISFDSALADVDLVAVSRPKIFRFTVSVVPPGIVDVVEHQRRVQTFVLHFT